MKKQILKNILSNYAGRGIGLFFSFLLVPFLIWKLGIIAFGVIILADSLMRFVEVASNSLRISLSRHATFSLSRGDQPEFLEYLSTGRYLLFAASVVVLLVGATLSVQLTHILHIPEALAFQSKILFLLMTGALMISLPNSVYWAVLYSKQRFDLINFCLSFGALLRVVLTFAAFTFLPTRYRTLIVYGVIYFAEALGENYIIYLWQKRVMPGLSFHPKYFRRKKVREVLSFGGYISMSSLSSVIYENVMNVLINLYWGPAYNAIYGISMKFPILMRRLFVEPAWTLTPTFTHLVAKGEKKKLEQLLFSYSKIMSVFSMPITLFLMIAAPFVVRIWVGPDFELAAKLMPLQVLPMLFVISGAACVCVINAHGRVKLPGIVSVVSTILRIVFGVLLVVKFSMGLMGIVIASTVVSVLATILYSTNYACRIADLSVWRFWMESYVRPLTANLIILAVLYWAAKTFVPHPLVFGPALIALGLGGIALYAALVYGFVTSRDERRYLRELFDSMVKAAGARSKAEVGESEGML